MGASICCYLTRSHNDSVLYSTVYVVPMKKPRDLKCQREGQTACVLILLAFSWVCWTATRGTGRKASRRAQEATVH